SSEVGAALRFDCDAGRSDHRVLKERRLDRVRELRAATAGPAVPEDFNVFCRRPRTDQVLDRCPGELAGNDGSAEIGDIARISRSAGVRRYDHLCGIGTIAEGGGGGGTVS